MKTSYFIRRVGQSGPSDGKVYSAGSFDRSEGGVVSITIEATSHSGKQECSAYVDMTCEEAENFIKEFTEYLEWARSREREEGLLPGRNK